MYSLIFKKLITDILEYFTKDSNINKEETKTNEKRTKPPTYLDPSQNQTIYFQIKLSKQFKSNFKTRNFYKRCKSKSHFQRRTNQYTQPPFL